MLSGGLDSSIVLTHVREMHPDCVALTIGAPGSDDLVFARRLCADLGVPHEVISVRPRMYRPLFAGMQRSFGYEVLAPVRRDFSVVLSQCGHDLDRALAQTGADYTAIEHARDLVGALRWNAATALRSRARH